MPGLNVTQKHGIVYFNSPDGVDLCGMEGTVVVLTQNSAIPEFVGTPVSAVPTQGQMLAVVLQGQPNEGTCSGALFGVFSGFVNAALSETPGTITAGTPLTVTANGTWKAAVAGEMVYAESVHAPYWAGKAEIAFVAPYTAAAGS